MCSSVVYKNLCEGFVKTLEYNLNLCNFVRTPAMLNSPRSISVTSELSMVPPPSLTWTAAVSWLFKCSSNFRC